MSKPKEANSRFYTSHVEAVPEIEYRMLGYAEKLIGRVPTNEEISDNSSRTIHAATGVMDFYWGETHVLSLIPNQLPLPGGWVWYIDVLANPGA
jgi:hypothetical protein